MWIEFIAQAFFFFFQPCCKVMNCKTHLYEKLCLYSATLLGLFTDD